jgi:hypothetical protein
MHDSCKKGVLRMFIVTDEVPRRFVEWVER